MIKKHTGILICLILLNYIASAQNWKLKLSSNVELRTWKLSNKFEKEEKALGGAIIKLLSGNKVVTEITSKPNGDFTIEVPANGEFLLEVLSVGCNTKRFAVSTMGVPEKVGTDNFKPSYSIGGFIMARPFSGIDYSALKNPLLKIAYQEGSQKFDNDEEVTQRGLRTIANLSDAEADMVSKFCELNKAGDAALNKNDCALAKTNYEKAIALIPGEQYPATQLVKTAECLKQKDTQKDADKKAIADAVAKAAADKAAREKAESDKLVMAAAQSAQKKAAEEKASEKQVKTTAPSQETPKQNAAGNTTITPKANAILKVKPKSEKELKVEEKQAKQREGRYKSKAEERRKKKEQEAAEEAEKRREGMAAAEAKIIEEDKAEAAKIQERKEKEREGKAAAEAKILEEDKAEAAKKLERKQKQEEEREKERQEEMAREKEAASKRELEESEYKTPQPLGVNKYKETITKADDYFKMKRYPEAKKMYEEALVLKAGDPYATGKLDEIAKLSQPK